MDLKSGGLLAVGPVDDLALRDQGVGQDDKLIFPGHDRRSTEFDLPHPAYDAVHFDDIMHLDGAVKQDDDAWDEIVKQMLQTSKAADPTNNTERSKPSKVIPNNNEMIVRV